MRYLILSDIHANLEALDAVLGAARATPGIACSCSAIWWGTVPSRTRSSSACARSPVAVIRGNHDKAACGVDDAAAFNHLARRAAEWTYETLTDEHRAWLRDLPAGPAVIDDTLEICHGAPFDEDA